MTAVLRGTRGLERKLAQMDDRLRTTALVAALQDGGEVIAGNARSRAPQRTGNLRRSIKVRVKRRGRDPIVSIGSNVRYAHLIEFGHAMVGPKPRRVLVGSVPARPFLRPAADEGKHGALSRIISRLREVIR